MAMETHACALCRQTRFRFSRAIALGHYQGALRAAVLRMKHASERYLACAVGELLAEHAQGQLDEGRPDLLVSTPMHWWRRLRRGGSTTEAITEVMADRMAICQGTSIFRCRRNTKKQSTLAPADRRRNVSGAYTISESYDLVDAHVGLVDDTLTTGATANELSKLLLLAGARRVTLFVVARAMGGAGS
jgi:ComF family protein